MANISSTRNSARVLVTGANGFLGSHLCRNYAQQGKPFRALMRPGSHSPIFSEGDIAFVSDLEDRVALRRALSEIDTVIHLAARVHVMHEKAANPHAEFRRINVEGTRVLMEEAVRSGVRKVVFVSSIKAMGERNERAWTEEDVPAPVDPYGASKLAAEKLIEDISARSGINFTSLRFPLLYGPGIKANMLRLFQIVDRGIPLPLGAIQNRRSLLFVGNAVAAIQAVSSSEKSAGETFLISDGNDLSTPDLIREIAQALGRPARLIAVPEIVFKVAGYLEKVLSSTTAFPLTSSAIDRLMNSLTIDSSKISNTIGFCPPYSVSEGLSETAMWYRASGEASGVKE